VGPGVGKLQQLLTARGRKAQNRTNYRLNLLNSSPVFRLQDFCYGLLAVPERGFLMDTVCAVYDVYDRALFAE
jgi:hypothetical protein